MQELNFEDPTPSVTPYPRNKTFIKRRRRGLSYRELWDRVDWIEEVRLTHWDVIYLESFNKV